MILMLYRGRYKIQFMKMFTEDARRKYDKNNDGKISDEEMKDSD